MLCFQWLTERAFRRFLTDNSGRNSAGGSGISGDFQTPVDFPGEFPLSWNSRGTPGISESSRELSHQRISRKFDAFRIRWDTENSPRGDEAMPSEGRERRQRLRRPRDVFGGSAPNSPGIFRGMTSPPRYSPDEGGSGVFSSRAHPAIEAQPASETSWVTVVGPGSNIVFARTPRPIASAKAWVFLGGLCPHRARFRFPKRGES